MLGESLQLQGIKRIFATSNILHCIFSSTTLTGEKNKHKTKRCHMQNCKQMTQHLLYSLFINAGNALQTKKNLKVV